MNLKNEINKLIERYSMCVKLQADEAIQDLKELLKIEPEQPKEAKKLTPAERMAKAREAKKK